MKSLQGIFWQHVDNMLEYLDAYLNSLKGLTKDCQFKSITADAYRQVLIRDAFINGIQSQNIRQPLRPVLPIKVCLIKVSN